MTNQNQTYRRNKAGEVVVGTEVFCDWKSDRTGKLIMSAELGAELHLVYRGLLGKREYDSALRVERETGLPEHVMNGALSEHILGVLRREGVGKALELVKRFQSRGYCEEWLKYHCGLNNGGGNGKY